MREQEEIVVEIEETKNYAKLVVNAAEIEVFDGGDDRTIIQMCDVMAWDDGDGDPIAGCEISLAAGQPLAWATALADRIGYVVVPQSSEPATAARIVAAARAFVACLGTSMTETYCDDEEREMADALAAHDAAHATRAAGAHDGRE